MRIIVSEANTCRRRRRLPPVAAWRGPMVSGDCQIAKPTIPIRNAEAMMALSPSAQPRKMLTLNRAVIKSSKLAGVTFILRPVVLADSRARADSIKAKEKRGGVPDEERMTRALRWGMEGAPARGRNRRHQFGKKRVVRGRVWERVRARNGSVKMAFGPGSRPVS